MPNIELLEKTLEHIEADVTAWNQRHWRSVEGLAECKPELLPTQCGTAMCFAGEAIQLNNAAEWIVQPADIKAAKKADDKSKMLNMYYALEYVYAQPKERGAIQLTHPVTGKMVWAKSASVRGQEVLGLDRDSAGRLFFEENTLDDLRSAVAHIKEHGDLMDWDMPTSDDVEDE